MLDGCLQSRMLHGCLEALVARSLTVCIQELGFYEEFKSHQNISLSLFFLPFLKLCRCMVCGIIVPQPGIKPTLPAVEVESQPLDCQGSPQDVSLSASLRVASYCPQFHPVGMPWDERVFVFFFFSSDAKGKIKSDCFLHNSWMRLMGWRPKQMFWGLEFCPQNSWQ